MPSKLKKAIGAVKDQTSIGLAKVSSYTATSSLEVAVLKATTHDDSIPVEHRHLQDILTLVSSNKMNASVCARAIGKRITRTRSWAVAVKSLILVLRIFQDGDPYFPREVLHAMKRGSKILNLSGFKDDSSSSPWDYSGFVQTLAQYLGERLDCFLTGKLQRRRTANHRRINETIREMKPGMLIDKISCWQNLLDRAVATRPTGAAKTNVLVMNSLYAIVQESFDLYKDISDGLALLLDSFFHLQYNSCVNAFEACVKATKQFEDLSGFYDFCKIIGVGRTSEYPCIQMISDELLSTLREFLKDQTSFPPMKPRFSHHQRSNPIQSPSSSSSSHSHDTSLEELVSATELSSGKDQPSISIDLETYLITDHEFEKKSIQSNTNSNGNDDTLSTRSLPISNSAVNLFDDLTNDIEQPTIEPVSGNDWDDLVLFEETKPSFQSKVYDSIPQYSEGNSWELVLTQTALTPSSNQPPYQQQNSIKYYNPFLQDNLEMDEKSMYTQASFPDNEDIFSSPTFKATPPVLWTGGCFLDEVDPFARAVVSNSADQSFGRSMNSENLQQQQQMWLQQQSKIMARHSP